MMQKIQLTSSYEEYNSLNELPADYKSLMLEAHEAAETAYAPYSDFHVGAAVLLANGEIIKGSNQENAAYPSGLCAERVAVFASAVQYPGVKIIAIAVTAMPGSQEEPVMASPCGACRQVMAEYEHLYHQDIKFIMYGSENKIIVLDSIKALLPFSFNSDQLSGK
ncbi:MAG TPA: cytidine deaminase [Bacteroidia bacterium]|nr:cytidine deaminase [Bacteroidia bacterium]HOZ90436.1 cytidine deaminase [Bacteroidia bacterium]HQW17006.1 cytidine deaminase [Bacteroidia bacterium]HQW48407.1 cytidine deaminase [Bacteroidia bacterium]HQX69203.1 cytidine deaminase [Bacteroidia bacterium]